MEPGDPARRYWIGNDRLVRAGQWNRCGIQGTRGAGLTRWIDTAGGEQRLLQQRQHGREEQCRS